MTALQHVSCKGTQTNSKQENHCVSNSNTQSVFRQPTPDWTVGRAVQPRIPKSTADSKIARMSHLWEDNRCPSPRLGQPSAKQRLTNYMCQDRHGH
jgi:hypothetical protein